MTQRYEHEWVPGPCSGDWECAQCEEQEETDGPRPTYPAECSAQLRRALDAAEAERDALACRALGEFPMAEHNLQQARADNELGRLLRECREAWGVVDVMMSGTGAAVRVALPNGGADPSTEICIGDPDTSEALRLALSAAPAPRQAQGPGVERKGGG